jgi:ABC-type transport system involved in cytochrome c biogenesis permease subunit
MNFSFSSKRFWNRLGHPNAIGRGLYILAFIFIVMLSFAFDAVRLGNYTWLWVPANILGAAIALVPLLPAVVIKRRRNTTGQQQPWFNIVVCSLFFGLKNLTMLFITPVFGIVEDGIPAFRLIGGLIIGFSVLALYANVVGNRLEREASLAKLRETEGDLVAFREAAFEQLEEENREAALKTFNVLSPQLEDLQKSVAESKDIITLASRMRDFIRLELRPFSEKLSLEAVTLSRDSAAQDRYRDYEPMVMVNISKSIRVWNSFLPVPIVIYLMSSFIVPKATALDIVFVAALFVAMLFTIKLLTLRLPALTVIPSFVVLTGIGFVSGIPGYFLLYQIPNESGVPALLPTFLIMHGWSVIAASQAHILDLKQSMIEEQLTIVIDELARENKLYQQKTWLARHGWYLLLHGVVQPALTSASIRVGSSKELTPQVRDHVIEDLQRALDALQQGHSQNQSLDQSISEITSVWRGICEIQCTISNEVQEIAANKLVVSQVLNEILKEVISNGVRHGQATTIQANIQLLDPSDLMVLVTNDGLKPTQEKIESVGSRMLDAICLERTLNWNEATQRTEFKAVVPF